MENLVIQGLTKLQEIKENLQAQTKEKPKDDYLMNKRDPDRDRADNAVLKLTTDQKDGSGKKEGGSKLDSLGAVLTGKPKKKATKRKPIDYQYVVTMKNQVNAKKFFNTALNVGQYLQGMTRTLLPSENFESKFLREYPRILWETEKMEEIGDYLLLFPNPDFFPNIGDGEGIRLNVALEYFDNILDTSYKFDSCAKFKKSLREAFIESFLKLDEIIPQKEGEKESKGAADGNAPKSTFCGGRKQLKSDAKGPVATEGEALVGKEKADGAKVDPLKKTTSGDPKSIQSGDAPPKGAQAPPNPKENPAGAAPAAGGKGDGKGKSSKSKKNQPTDDDAGSEQQKAIPRRVWNPKTYSPPRLETFGDDKDADQIDSDPAAQWTILDDPRTKDFQTLIRKCVLTALGNQGFIAREVFVEKGEWIAVVLTMSEESLRVFAHEMGLHKPVDLGLTDLASLEPVDEKNRPLRLNAILRNENAWKAMYHGTFMSKSKKERINKLRTDINELLEYDCNMKKIFRMAGCMWTEDKTDDLNAGSILEHTKISLQTWLDYRDYLTEISLHVKEIWLLREKMMTVMNAYYTPDRIAIHKNIPKSRLVRQDIYKMINSLIVNAFKTTIEKYPVLENFWMCIDKEPSEYLYSYQHSNNNQRPRNREITDRVWSETMFTFPHDPARFLEEAQKQKEQDTVFKRVKDALKGHAGHPPNMFEILYESDKLEVYTSLFNNTERLKIIEFAINKFVDINQLGHMYIDMNKLKGLKLDLVNFASQFADDKLILFPLHDRRLTSNTDYSAYFKKLKHLKKLYDTMLSNKLPIKLQYDGNLPKSPGMTGKTPAVSVMLPNSAISGVTVSKFDGPRLQPKKAPTIPAGSDDENLGNPDDPADKSQSMRRNQLAPEPFSPKSDMRQGTFQDHDPYPGRSDLMSVGASKLGLSSKRMRNFDDSSVDASVRSRDRLVVLLKGIVSTRSDFDSYYLWNFLIDNEEEPDADSEEQGAPNQPLKPAQTATSPAKAKTSTRKKMFDKVGSMFKSKMEKRRSKPRPQANVMETKREAYEKHMAFVELYQEIKEMYYIPEDRLVDSMLQSFMTSINLRNVLLPEFTKLGISVFRTERDNTLEYPLKQTFVKSLAITPKMNVQNTIVHYFGEKIGMYFLFVQNFQASTWKISIEGFLITLFDMLFVGFGEPQQTLATLKATGRTADYYFKLIYIILKCYFALRTTTWGTKFLKRWEQTESDFITTYGATDEQELTIRPRFKGTWRRNIVTDQMDEYFESSSTARFKQTVIYLVLILSIIGTIISSYFILRIKRVWCRNYILDQPILGSTSGFNYMDQLVWNLIEMAKAIGLNIAFTWIAKRLVSWRNHKYREHHQSDLTFLLSAFTLVNNSTIGLLIGFDCIYRTSYTKDSSGADIFRFDADHECVYPSCSIEFSVFLILSKAVQILYEVLLEMFLLRVVSFVLKKSGAVYTKFIGAWCSKKTAGPTPKRAAIKKSASSTGANTQKPDLPSFQEDMASKHSKHSLEHKDTFDKMTDDPELLTLLRAKGVKQSTIAKAVNKSILTQVISNGDKLYKQINNEIHVQVTKFRDGSGSGDVDPTLEPYLSIVSSVFFCCCFGVVLPFNFAASFAVCAVERYLISYKFTKKEKRPAPENCTRLSQWKDFIQAVVYLSCISSSFYVAFVVLLIDGTEAKVIIFLALLAGTITFSTVFSNGIESFTEATQTLANRMKFIKDFAIPNRAEEKRQSKNTMTKVVSVSMRMFGEYQALAGAVDVFELAKQNDEQIDAQNKEAEEKEVLKKLAREGAK